MRIPPGPLALGLSCLALSPVLQAQSMTVDSLDGPVTQNEINSFVTYIGSINPVVWPNTGSMENQYAQGASGEQVKAMGLMFEISQNTAILNRMIVFCDTLLSQRNDLLASPNGQRTYWNGKISPAWPGQALGTTPVYSTSASGDCAGHLANCARVILQTPSLWNTPVPDGDPFGYGGTYLQRAQTYVTQADFTFSQCFFPDMLTLTNSGLTNIYCYPTSYPYQPGNQYPWNQAMMMSYPLQNLAIAHSILGDNPSLVTKYDTLVQTNVGRFFSDSSFVLHKQVTDGAGNQAYDWSYTPTANGGEDSNHGSLDVAGFYRAYDTGRYGVTFAQMTPFANMVVDIFTGTIGSYYHGTVEGADGTGHAASTTYLRSGYFFSAEFRPDQYYNLVSGLHITAPGTTTSIDAFSRLMWIKNLRYIGSQDFTLGISPTSQNVTAGSAIAYTVSVAPQNGFTGTVAFTVTGLPTGVTGNFNPTSVTGGSGSTILTVTTAGTTTPGTYTATVNAASGSLHHSIGGAFTVLANPVAAPVFSPGGGTYTSSQSVTITSSTSGASIRYTTDGSTPSETAGTLYTAPVAIGASTTLKAIAYKSGMSDSTVTSATYTINLPVAAPPTFSPPAGTYSTAQSVTLSTATSGTSIRYTTDGSTPSETAGTLYSSPVAIASSLTLKALAYKAGFTDSSVTSGVYTISSGSASQFTIPATAVTASSFHTGYPPANTVDNDLNTRWACSGDGCWIQYDLGAVNTVDYVEIAWYLGNARIYTFDLQLSSDGTTWNTILNRQTSSGTTLSLEKYSFTAAPGRYVRVVGHLSNVDSYTNITEFQAWGTSGTGGTTFTINASAGANGTISPTGTVTVNQGSSQTFTITPNSGYTVSTVTVDGGSAGAVTSYTFSNVQANHTISASFTASSNSNIAPSGTAYGWNANTAATANTNRTALPGLNDNNLSADVDIDSAGDAVNAWEGAGVVWTSAKTITSADFINGTVTTGGDGFLTANCQLEFSTDGSTWTASGWTISPAYPNSASASGQTYTFTGTAATNIKGARIVGQVRTADTSYHWIVKEVQFIGH